jgi:DNA replication protein DnaC
MAPSSDRPPKDPIKVDIGSREHHCGQHGPFTSHGMQFTVGKCREIWTPCPDCEEARRAETLQAEAEERADREQKRLCGLLEQTEMPARWQLWTLATYTATLPAQASVHAVAVDFAENFQRYEANGESLIFAGMPGTGKTHLAVGILQHLLPERVGHYTAFMDMVRSVRGTWRKGSDRSEADVLDTLGRVPLLVIDELGVGYGGDSETTILFDVIDRRYRDMRPTILITNMDRAGFTQAVGERTFDRLTETARWIAFDWPSYRATARLQRA